MKFNCPHCQQDLEADDSLNGATVECPVCGKPFVIQAALPVEPVQSTEPTEMPPEPSVPEAESSSESVPAPEMAVPLPELSAFSNATYEPPPSSTDQPLGVSPSPSASSFEPATESSSKQNEATKNTSMTAALVFQCIMLGAVLLFAIRGGAAGMFVVPVLCAIVFSAILHYNCWSVVPAGVVRMTPDKAVGYLFIPILGWFSSIGGLGTACAMLAQRRGVQGFEYLRILGRVLAMLLCSSVVGFFSHVLGLFVAIGEVVVWFLFYRGVTKLLGSISETKDFTCESGCGSMSAAQDWDPIGEIMERFKNKKWMEMLRVAMARTKPLGNHLKRIQNKQWVCGLASAVAVYVLILAFVGSRGMPGEEEYRTAEAFARDESETALVWYRQAGEKGHLQAQKKLGHIYSFKSMGLWSGLAKPKPSKQPSSKSEALAEQRKRDKEKKQYLAEARKWYLMAARQGDREAIDWIGKDADDYGNLEMLLWAAQLGSPNAQYGMGRRALYTYGMFGELGYSYDAEHTEKAEPWLRKAAEQGHAKAKKLLEYMGVVVH